MRIPISGFQGGFTLIELIVVISVISILSTIGIVSFVNYDRSQQLNGAVSDIINILNLAKSNSLSQVKPDACVQQEQQGIVLDGYEVEVNTSTSKLTLNARCSSGDGQNLSENLIKSLTLPTNIRISSVTTLGGTGTFFYPLFSKKVDGGKMCIQSYGTSAKSIDLSELGIVTIGNPC